MEKYEAGGGDRGHESGDQASRLTTDALQAVFRSRLAGTGVLMDLPSSSTLWPAGGMTAPERAFLQDQVARMEEEDGQQPL